MYFFFCYLFFYRFLCLSMPNYISVIFLANVFACRHAHFVVEEKRTVSYPYLATSPRTRGRPLHRTLFLTELYLARLKFRRKAAAAPADFESRRNFVKPNNCVFVSDKKIAFNLTTSQGTVKVCKKFYYTNSKRCFPRFA